MAGSQHGHHRACCGPGDSMGCKQPPIEPQGLALLGEGSWRIITAEKWMPWEQVGDRHGVTALWGRWVWAEPTPEACRQLGRDHVGLVPHHGQPPIASSGARARQAGREHPAPLLPTRRFPAGWLSPLPSSITGSGTVASRGKRQRLRAEPLAAATSRHRLHDAALP